jgi:hypothetical protein
MGPSHKFAVRYHGTYFLGRGQARAMEDRSQRTVSKSPDSDRTPKGHCSA